MGALLRRRPPRAASAEAALDIIDHHGLEVGRERRAAQGRGLLAVDEDRRGRRLAGAGQRNADVGVLALARSVDDAAHVAGLRLDSEPNIRGVDPLLPAERYTVAARRLARVKLPESYYG